MDGCLRLGLLTALAKLSNIVRLGIWQFYIIYSISTLTICYLQKQHIQHIHCMCMYSSICYCQRRALGLLGTSVQIILIYLFMF